MYSVDDNNTATLTIAKCSYLKSFIAVLLLVVPCQCRDFYAITKYLSIPSTCAILILAFLICANVISLSNDNTIDNDDAITVQSRMVPEDGTDILKFLKATSAFLFAYQGQAIFLEIMSEMRDSQEFPKAIAVAYAIMSVVYGSFALFVAYYGGVGRVVPEFSPDVLSSSSLKAIVGGTLAVLHISVSYVITCQPLHRWLHSVVFPRTAGKESCRANCHWFLVTVGFLLFGYVIGNLIPFFADVQAILGSLFGAPVVFAYPVLFYFALTRRNRSFTSEQQITTMKKKIQTSMNWKHTIIGVVFLLVCTPLFCILGTTGAIASIIQNIGNSPLPFSCQK